MAKMSAAERYAARKRQTAVDLRARTIAAADGGMHCARLRSRYGPDWRGVLNRSLQRRLDEWSATAERNPYRSPSDPEIGWSTINVRPYLRPSNPRSGVSIDPATGAGVVWHD